MWYIVPTGRRWYLNGVSPTPRLFAGEVRCLLCPIFVLRIGGPTDTSWIYILNSRVGRPFVWRLNPRNKQSNQSLNGVSQRLIT